MRSILVRVTRATGRGEFRLDNRIALADAFPYFAEKLLSLVRGLVRLQKPIFLAKGVTLYGGRHFSFGKGVSIGRNCSIRCLGVRGLIIGDHSSIGSNSIVSVSGSLSDLGSHIVIGARVGLGDFSHIGGAGGVTIGDDTISGAYLSIHPENHVFDDKNTPIRLQGVTRQGVRIGRNCWLGAKVTFLDGSAIGDGCVVAAGAVVRGVFGDNLLLAGVPAKVIRERVSP